MKTVHVAPQGPRLYLGFATEGEGITLSYDRKMLIRSAIAEALFYERVFFNAEISVTVCDDEYIKSLNKKYRDKNKATDVLSFPMYDEGELPKGSDADGATVVLGDIVLSLPHAVAQARELGHSLEREIAFLCIHSTLHLLGYDHERGKAEDEDMCRRQREIVAKLGL